MTDSKIYATLPRATSHDQMVPHYSAKQMHKFADRTHAARMAAQSSAAKEPEQLPLPRREILDIAIASGMQRVTPGCAPEVLTFAAKLAERLGPAPIGYFSFSDECGFDRHDTADAAKASAEEMLDSIRKELGGEEWPMDVESVCWGSVIERAAEHNPTTADDGEKHCDYVLKGVPQPAASQAAPELGPDGKEWAKTQAGYAHVASMWPRADGVVLPGGARYWYGWAVRGAFVAGAEWQEGRGLSPVQSAERENKALLWDRLVSNVLEIVGVGGVVTIHLATSAAPTPELQRFVASKVAGLPLPPTCAVSGHDLYTSADKDRPGVICDSNGEVVLGLCKKCGKGEAELFNQDDTPSECAASKR